MCVDISSECSWKRHEQNTTNLTNHPSVKRQNQKMSVTQNVCCLFINNLSSKQKVSERVSAIQAKTIAIVIETSTRFRLPNPSVYFSLRSKIVLIEIEVVEKHFSLNKIKLNNNSSFSSLGFYCNMKRDRICRWCCCCCCNQQSKCS